MIKKIKNFICNLFGITVTTTDKYTFSLGTNASVTEEGGGPTVSAGPVTLTP